MFSGGGRFTGSRGPQKPRKRRGIPGKPAGSKGGSFVPKIPIGFCEIEGKKTIFLSGAELAEFIDKQKQKPPQITIFGDKKSIATVVKRGYEFVECDTEKNIYTYRLPKKE